jgi:hypothetical protein
VAEPAGGHLRATGVVDAHEQHRRLFAGVMLVVFGGLAHVVLLTGRSVSA